MVNTTNRAASAESTRIVRGILEAAGERCDFSQRSLAADLGIALGLTNAYVKRCVRKGLLKVSQAPARRYGYYLTAKGFAEKKRLTVEYLKCSLALFRQTKLGCSEVLHEASAKGWRRVALAGVSEVAEIMALCALESDIEIIAVVDFERAGQKFLKWKVVSDFSADFRRIDGVLVTTMGTDGPLVEDAIERFGHERVLAPRLEGSRTVATEAGYA